MISDSDREESDQVLPGLEFYEKLSREEVMRLLQDHDACSYLQLELLATHTLQLLALLDAYWRKYAT